MAKHTDKKMHLVISDVHVPFEDKVAVKLVLQFIRDNKPATVHLLGDISDFVQLSKFDRDPTRRETLADDLRECRAFLTLLKDTSPRSRLIFSAGNHENRLQRYLWSKAPELAGLPSLSLPQLLDFDRLGITFHDVDDPYCVGPLLFTHGVQVRKWSGYSARAHFEKYGRSVIHGHVHRAASYYQTVQGNVFGVWENPCLADVAQAKYVTQPNWQHGFSVVTVDKDRFSVEQCLIINGRFTFRGKTYGRAVTTASRFKNYA